MLESCLIPKQKKIFILVCASIFSAVKLLLIENFILTTPTYPWRVMIVRLPIFFVFCLFYYFSSSRWKACAVLLYISSVIYQIISIEYFLYFGNIFSLTLIDDIAMESIQAACLGYHFHAISFVAIADLPIFAYFLYRGTVQISKFFSLLILVPIGLSVEVAHIRSNLARLHGRDSVLRTSGFIIHEYYALKIKYEHPEIFQYGSRKLFPGSLNHPNILLLQVESLDSRMPFVIWKNQLVMPFLNALSKRSYFFPYILSFHGVGGSSDADFTMEYSTLPLKYHVSLNQIIDQSNALPNRLSEYKSYLIHGNEGGFFGRKQGYHHAGFSKLLFSTELALPEKGWGNADGDVFQKVIEIAQASKKPFYIHCITLSTHEPFSLWTSYYENNIFVGAPEPNLFTAFHYEDSVLKYVVETVRSIPNTWVIITGDHPPGAAALRYKSTEFKDRNYNFQFVPLYIISPEMESKVDDSLAHSFLDVGPTILSISGVKTEAKTYGDNLLTQDVGCEVVPLVNGEKITKRILRRKIDSVVADIEINR